MPRRAKSKKKLLSGHENAFIHLPLPSGVPVPMCFCGDPCKVAKSDEIETFRQTYWMCANFAFEPTVKQRVIGWLVRIGLHIIFFSYDLSNFFHIFIFI